MNKIEIKEDLVGPMLLAFLLVGTSFHFITRDMFTFYREFIALLFAFFLLKRVLGELISGAKPKVRKEVLYFCIFPIMLILLSLGDPMVNLYGNSITNASELLTEGDATIYILRNAIIYMPMVLYFYVYGISEDAIRYLSIIILLVAPFSTVKMIESLDLGYEVNLPILLAFGPDFIPYNSYVPYLTFPVLAGLYLIFSKTNVFVKMAAVAILLYLLFFIFISSSRQSFLFCIIAFLFFFINTSAYSWKSYLYFGVFLLIVSFTTTMLLQDFELNDELISRFTTAKGAIESSRLKKIEDGLMMLNMLQIFTGAGLTSVNGGPHNDYIQLLQRIGLLSMIVSFMPFMMAFKGAAFMMRKSSELKPLYIYITLSIFFTLFHSIFGHPREDAFQALFCFLGLALWLGTVRRQDLIQSKKDHIKTVNQFKKCTNVNFV